MPGIPSRCGPRAVCADQIGDTARLDLAAARSRRPKPHVTPPGNRIGRVPSTPEGHPGSDVRGLVRRPGDSRGRNTVPDTTPQLTDASAPSEPIESLLTVVAAKPG